MSTSLRLSVPDLTGGEAATGFYSVADAATRVDGYDPFNEQARLDVQAGRRSPVLAVRDGVPVGAAILGQGELDLVVHPDHRSAGHGAALLDGVLPGTPPDLRAWSHGDHPAARALAASRGFDRVRTLLQLRLEPLPEDAPRPLPDGVTIHPFRPGVDDREWVELNALIFAEHPEQGSITVEGLWARQSEDWFDADDFLLARGPDGSMIGYNWLKLTPDDPDTGEIYVVGVAPASAGHGLGRALMDAGLARLSERRRHAATLYVESDNTPALALYRGLGFADFAIDVQYRRRGPEPR